MAIVTTHTLDGVHGTHAGDVGVALHRICGDGRRVVVFDAATDAGGRLSQTLDIGAEHDGADYELVFQSGRYFAASGAPAHGMRILREVVIRFAMPDPAGRYHLPVILSPNSYSVWWSS